MKPIREIIDNFSGGLNTLFSARDLVNNQFQELRNWIIRLKGQIKKAVLDSSYTTPSGISTVTTLVDGRGFHIYRTSKSIAGTDSGTEFGVFYLNGGATHKLYRLGINPLNSTASEIGTLSSSWTYVSSALPDFYSQNEILRLSDGNFANNNKSLWFGYIDKDVLGEGLDYTKAPTLRNPSSFLSNTEIGEWTLDYQKCEPPLIVKMGGYADSTGKVDADNKVGLFVYDPRHKISVRRGAGFASYETDFFQEWGQALEAPSGDTFSEDDRWTATFTYDYVYESELGREYLSPTSIGITGFEAVPSDDEIDGDDRKYMYEVSGTSYESLLLNTTFSKDTILIKVGNSGSANVTASSDVFTIGDIIKINDEHMKVYDISSSGLNVVRGVYKSKVADNHAPLSKIYRVPKKQSARAVNLVLYIGGNGTTTMNKRITSVNIYWKPKDEVDWFLVDRLDIKEGATLNKVGRKKSEGLISANPHPATNSDEYNSFFEDSTGRWFFCPKKITDEEFWTASQLQHYTGTTAVDFPVSYFSSMNTKWSGTGYVVHGGTLDFSNGIPSETICFSAPYLLSIEPNTGTSYVFSGENSLESVRNSISTNISRNIRSVTATGRNYIQTTAITEKASTYYVQMKFQDSATTGGDPKITFQNNGVTTLSDITADNPEDCGFVAGQRLHICPIDGLEDEAVNLGIYTIKAVGSTEITIESTGLSEEFRTDFDSYSSSVHDFGNNSVMLIASSGVNHYNYQFTGYTNATYSSNGITPRTPDTLGDGRLNQRCLSFYNYRKDAVTTMYIPFHGDKDMSYAALTGRSESIRIRDVRWKCSTVVNNMAVIGNIKTEDINGTSIIKDDRIMWSKQGAHDDFTLTRSKDVSISDSGEITNLVTHGQHIYAVKYNAVYILDSMQNFRAVGSFSGIGSDYYGGAISTPHGVAVANSVKTVILPDNVDITEIIRDTYQNTTFSDPILSFNSKKNELRIVPDSSGECNEMIYSFNDKSWSQRHKSADNHSNYLPAFNGSEFYLVEINGSFKLMEVEAGSEKNNNTAVLHTKDFHFGDPSRKKYITDVYISYKSSSTFELSLYIDEFEVWTKTMPSKVNKDTYRVKVNRDGRIFSFKITSPYGASNIEIDDVAIEGWHLERN